MDSLRNSLRGSIGGDPRGIRPDQPNRPIAGDERFGASTSRPGREFGRDSTAKTGVRSALGADARQVASPISTTDDVFAGHVGISCLAAGRVANTSRIAEFAASAPFGGRPYGWISGAVRMLRKVDGLAFAATDRARAAISSRKDLWHVEQCGRRHKPRRVPQRFPGAGASTFPGDVPRTRYPSRAIGVSCAWPRGEITETDRIIVIEGVPHIGIPTPHPANGRRMGFAGDVETCGSSMGALRNMRWCHGFRRVRMSP